MYSKKEFAAMCGITTKALSTCKERGKVKYSGDHIDDSIEINKEFLLFKQVKNKFKAEQPKSLKLIRPLNKMERQDPVINNEASDSGEDENPKANGVYEKMVLEKKQLEIKKLKEEIQKLKLGNNKTQGDFVSIDLVKNLIVLHTESLKVAYEDALQEFIVQFSAKNQLGREDIFLMKSEVNANVNRTVTRSIEDTKKSLRRMQTEISEKRGVGERI